MAATEARRRPPALGLALLLALGLASAGAAARAGAGEEPSDAPAPPPVDKFAPPPLAVQFAKTDASVVRALSSPSSNTTGSFMYWADEAVGVELKSGSKIVFQVPDDFAATDRIDSITLVHRKENTAAATRNLKPIRGMWHGKEVTYEWDSEPAFMTVRCRDAATGQWVAWRGPHGRTQRGEPRAYKDPEVDDRRYSEPRDEKDPVWDVLPDCAKWLGRRRCDLIMVENTGNGGPTSAGRVHGIKVQYRPFRGDVLRSLDQLHVFTPSTVFADPDFSHRLVPHLGGGVDFEPEEADRLKTIYPNAEPISMATVDTSLANTYKIITPWLRVTAGGMIVRLRPYEFFAGCDIALGDSKYSGAANSSSQTDEDGQLGAQGKSLVSVFMRHPNSTGSGENMTVIIGTTRWMVQKFDVEAGSVLSVSPPDFDDVRIPAPHDPSNPWTSSFVRIDADVDPAYVMGIRCRYYASRTVKLPPPKPAPAPQQAVTRTNGVANTTSEAAQNATQPASNVTSTAAAANTTGSAPAQQPTAVQNATQPAAPQQSTSTAAAPAPAPTNTTSAPAPEQSSSSSQSTTSSTANSTAAEVAPTRTS